MSLFGNLGTQNQQQQSGGSLFGGSLNNNQSKPLFGASTTNNSQPQQSSLFGNLGQPQQQAQNNTSSLFGQPQQNAQQQQPQGGGLLGGLGQSTQNTNTFGGSLLGASTAQQPQNRFDPTASLQTRKETDASLPAGDTNTLRTGEKSVQDRIQICFKKWNPQDPECLMQHYFYNYVGPERAPFFHPEPGDDERKWEESLAKKPSEGYIPVIAKGFQQLGARLNLQVQAVQQLQLRLHEMNNSLGAMMEKHELQLSVRAAEAKRRHVTLSQRCLSLAIRVQVMRSRGFVLEGVEEELKKKLAALEKGVFDPGFSGREEEIWARMVALRERSRWLQEETEKVGRQVNGGEKAGVDEEVLKKTKKILSDYDAQLTHLRKELGLVQEEYAQWEAASRPRS
ncbi:Nucleoporin nup57 [Zalaria obscura]|uniref:Nucleoporin nup57 n=1 Tax=Zalaria obscura TaxID=2024903 RepID=A0ACC3S6Q2_9PEZI